MHSSVMCRCLFRLMRRYFLGRWICLLVSERFRLVWQCCPFGCNTYIQFCVHWHGGQCQLRLVPDYAVVSLLECLWRLVKPKHWWLTFHQNKFLKFGLFYLFCLLSSYCRIYYYIYILTIRVFQLLSSSLLLFPQRFGRYVHRLSSSVFWRMPEDISAETLLK